MPNRRALSPVCRLAVCCSLALVALCGSVTAQTRPAARPNARHSAAASKIDSALVGVWGEDARGGYEFKADGTFIMEGAVTYAFDASHGTWHYWQPGMEAAAVTAEYSVSADGKSLSINLKKGTPFAHLKRIR